MVLYETVSVQQKQTKFDGVGPDVAWAAREKVLSFFFSFPDREFSLSDVCEETNIAKTTANIVVDELAKQGFLTVEPFGRSWRIKTVKEHPYHRTIKIPVNLRTIYASNVVDKIVERIPGAKAIVLFGSYRTGEDIEQSDLDIAVEVVDGVSRTEKIGVMRALLYRKNVPVNLFIFSRKKVDQNVFANIANGIVLYGFLEVNS